MLEDSLPQSLVTQTGDRCLKKMIAFRKLKELIGDVGEWESLPEPKPWKRENAKSPGFITLLFGIDSLPAAEDGQRRFRKKGFLRWLLESEHLDAPSMSKDNKTQ